MKDKGAGPELAAAVSNAGGLGVIGGLGMTPEFLTGQIKRLKASLIDPNLPFGVDLLIPQVGGSARKTNKDYTKGHLDELIDICIKEKIAVFVTAVGVPPPLVVEKLHAAKIPIMNMVGHVKHVQKAIEAGSDILCAQGSEAGGHTGDVPTSILIPKVVDACKGKISKLTGKPIAVVAAGGIFDGRGIAMALSFGAQAVWVGTRFLLATESGAPEIHRKNICNAGYDGTTRTLIYSGRPMRVLKTPIVMDWENNRKDEIQQLTSKGIIPMNAEREKRTKDGTYNFADFQYKNIIMGVCAGALTEKDIKPAKDIIEEMMHDAVQAITSNYSMLSKL